MSAEAPKIVDPDAKAAPKPDTKELAKPAKASKPRIDCNSEITWRISGRHED